jgi:hypothetical protein
MSTATHDDQAARTLAQGEAQHGPVIGSQDARSGFMTGHMRWVLAISVALGIMVMFGAWAFLANRVVVDQQAAAHPAAVAPKTPAG